MWINLKGNVRKDDGTLDEEVFDFHKKALAEYDGEPTIVIPGPTHTAYWLRPDVDKSPE